MGKRQDEKDNYQENRVIFLALQLTDTAYGGNVASLCAFQVYQVSRRSICGRHHMCVKNDEMGTI